ncbi:MAG: ribosomal protein S18-alanine N-acetyltransferase [Proteobacteria bacterium]|nr:ribosomal protein S18-alanine N-acetyltransferase [Pseudomonadota bacterium]
MIAFLSRLFARAPPRLADAGPGDAASFAEIHAASFRRGWSESEFERLLTERSVLAHRASAGSACVGFIVSRIAADEAEILSIAVATARRGRGLGRLLLDRHLRQLAGLGVRRVFLEVEGANTSAMRLYARLGFGTVGERRDYYAKSAGAATAAIVLRRELG